MMYTLPPSASHTSPYLGPNRPISALLSNSSANADHAVLSRFIISSASHLYFLEPTRSSSDPVLDVVWAGRKPVPHCSCHRLHLCSR